MGGPTQFLLCSAHGGWGKADGLALELRQFADLPLGAAIVYDARTMQRGMPNDSDRTQTLLQLSYVTEWWSGQLSLPPNLVPVSSPSAISIPQQKLLTRQRVRHYVS